MEAMRVFVYDRLKIDQSEHYVIKEMVIEGHTAVVQGYTLYDIKELTGGLPFAVKEKGSSILGDLLTIRDEQLVNTLMVMDNLQGAGMLFDRVQVVTTTGEHCYMYVGKDLTGYPIGEFWAAQPMTAELAGQGVANRIEMLNRKTKRMMREVR